MAEFREGKAPLRRLVDDVAYGVESLDSGAARDDLRRLAGALEVLYAVALDRGDLGNMPPATITELNEVVAAIASRVNAEPRS